MHKTIEKIDTTIEGMRVVGNIYMRRPSRSAGHTLLQKTTFLGEVTCPDCTKYPLRRYDANGDDINEVRRLLHEQVTNVYAIRNWEPWLLISIDPDESRDETRDIDGEEIVRTHTMCFGLTIQRIRRAVYDGKVIWSDYYSQITPPNEEDPEENDVTSFRMGRTSMHGTLIRDDERARLFIEKLKEGFANLEKQLRIFLSAENIDQTLDGMTGVLALEAPNGVQE